MKENSTGQVFQVCAQMANGDPGRWVTKRGSGYSHDKKKQNKQTKKTLNHFLLHNTAKVWDQNSELKLQNVMQMVVCVRVCAKWYCLQSPKPQTVVTVYWRLRFSDDSLNLDSSVRFSLTTMGNTGRSWGIHIGSHSWPFLTDITHHLKAFSNMLNAIRAFQNKPNVLCIPDRLSAISANDPSVQHHYSHRGLVDVFGEPKGSFESRFSDVIKQRRFSTSSKISFIGCLMSW